MRDYDGILTEIEGRKGNKTGRKLGCEREWGEFLKSWREGCENFVPISESRWGAHGR